jgi:hypothetical protein
MRIRQSRPHNTLEPNPTKVKMKIMKKVALAAIAIVAMFAMSSCSSSENCPAFQGSAEIEQPTKA